MKRTTPKTDGKTMQYGYAVVGDKIRKAEPAASSETATRRAEKLADSVVPTFVVEADSRAAADAAADEMYMQMYAVEAAETPVADDAPAAEAPAAPAATQAPTARPERSGFYVVARRGGETIATQHPERDAETAKQVALPPEFKEADADTTAIVKAKSRDAAVNRYEALAEAGQTFDADTVITTGSERRASTPRTGAAKAAPQTGPDTTATWKPAEAADGSYRVSKSGVLHSSTDCRFVKDTTPVLTDDTRSAVLTMLRLREGQEVTMPKSDDGKITPRFLCAFCSGTKIVAAEAPAAEEEAAAVAS